MEIKLLNNSENPYQTDTREWHVFLDICQVCKVGGVTTMRELNTLFDTTLDYYSDVLPVLENDGLIELIGQELDE